MARHLTRHLLGALRNDQRQIDDIETGVGEACANAVQHARHCQAFDLAITVDGATCRVWVIDGGPGFEVEQVLPAPPDAEGGRGLVLMRAVMDEVQVISHPDQGTAVRLVKVLDPGQ